MIFRYVEPAEETAMMLQEEWWPVRRSSWEDKYGPKADSLWPHVVGHCFRAHPLLDAVLMRAPFTERSRPRPGPLRVHLFEWDCSDVPCPDQLRVFTMELAEASLKALWLRDDDLVLTAVRPTGLAESAP